MYTSNINYNAEVAGPRKTVVASEMFGNYYIIVRKNYRPKKKNNKKCVISRERLIITVADGMMLDTIGYNTVAIRFMNNYI